MRLPVRAPMYAAVQIDKPILQPRLVIEPCHAIHPGRNLRAECTSRIQRVKRLVRVASRPEPVREAPEVGLINLIEHGHNGPVEQSCAPMPRCLTDVAARQPCGVQKKRTNWILDADICRYWRHVLRRRSQRRKPDWEQLRPIFEQRIPRPRGQRWPSLPQSFCS